MDSTATANLCSSSVHTAIHRLIYCSLPSRLAIHQPSAKCARCGWLSVARLVEVGVVPDPLQRNFASSAHLTSSQDRGAASLWHCMGVAPSSVADSRTLPPAACQSSGKHRLCPSANGAMCPLWQWISVLLGIWASLRTRAFVLKPWNRLGS